MQEAKPLQQASASSLAEEQTLLRPFDGVPDDILLLIASELEPCTLRALSCCSKRWSRVTQGEELGTLWLYRRASSLSSRMYHPNMCLAYTRHHPLASVAAAERLCTWASKDQELLGDEQQQQQECLVPLSICEPVLLWLAEGLARLQHGLALLQWLLKVEEDTLGMQQQPDSPEPLHRVALAHALRTAALHGQQTTLNQLLGPWPRDTLQLARLSDHQLIEHTAKGGHGPTLTYCLDTLGSGPMLLGTAAVAAASAGHFHLLPHLLQRGLPLTSQAACHALHISARHNNPQAVSLLLGCTCGHATHPPPSTAPASTISYTSTTTTTANCPAMGHPGVVPALREASSGGFLPIAQLLLAHLHAIPEEADGIILAAARSGHAQLLQLLFNHPACQGSVARGCAGLALLDAVAGGHADAVAVLAPRPDVASRYQAAVNEAASQGATEVVMILLAHPPAIRRNSSSPRSSRTTQELRQLPTDGSPASILLPRASSGTMQDVLDQALLHATLESRIDTMHALLVEGADPTWKGGMCLLSALSRGSHGAVKVLLEWGAGGGRALGEALRATAQAGDVNSLHLLLAHALRQCVQGGGDAPAGGPLEVSIFQRHLATVLQVAAQAGHLLAAKQVLGTWVDLHARLQEGGLLAREILNNAELLAEGLVTALSGAVQSGHATVAHWLLQQLQSSSAPPLEQQARQQRLQGVAMALVHAAAVRGHADALRCMLLHSGVDGPVRGGEGQQVVLTAAEQQHTPCVRLLLSRGADAEGSTLLSAASQGDQGLVRTLLEAACPLRPSHASSPIGHTTLEQHAGLGLRHGSSGPGAAGISKAAMGGGLSEPGAPLGPQTDVVGEAGMASVWLWGQDVIDWALVHAVEGGSLACTGLLLEWGADLDAYGGQPLAAACHLGSFKLVRMLLEAGADVHVVRVEDVRSLAERGWVDVAKMLRTALEHAGVTGMGTEGGDSPRREGGGAVYKGVVSQVGGKQVGSLPVQSPVRASVVGVRPGQLRRQW